jgi:membrane-associated phospholipid phosphatase
MSAGTDPAHAPGGGRWHGEAIREIVLAGLAALAYFGVRNLTAGSAATAFANADRIMRFEDTTHLDWERSLQARIIESTTLTNAVNWVYIWGHWPVIVTVGIVLFLRRRERYRLLRNAILVSGGIGFVFFAVLPVAPPRLADPALVDTVTLHSHAYRALQPPGLTDQYAAFPSLHFGWNLLAGIAVWGATRNPAVRMLAVIGPAAMAVAVVLTANHFIVDVLAGFLVVFIGLMAHRLFASLEPDSKSEGAPDRPRSGRQPSRLAPSRRARDPNGRGRRVSPAGASARLSSRGRQRVAHRPRGR